MWEAKSRSINELDINQVWTPELAYCAPPDGALVVVEGQLDEGVALVKVDLV